MLRIFAKQTSKHDFSVYPVVRHRLLTTGLFCVRRFDAYVVSRETGEYFGSLRRATRGTHGIKKMILWVPFHCELCWKRFDSLNRDTQRWTVPINFLEYFHSALDFRIRVRFWYWKTFPVWQYLENRIHGCCRYIILCSERKMGRRDYRQPEGERQAAARAINVSHKTGCGRLGAMTDGMDHNGTFSRFLTDLREVPTVFAGSGRTAAQVGLWCGQAIRSL